MPEDKLPESQIDGSYSVEPGKLNGLSTWQLMAESGEMTEEALRHCSRMPFMEYEVSGLLDFEGLEEAKELLISPKQRRIEAGLDPMLTSQGLSVEQRRQRNKRRCERMEVRRKGVKASVEKMRQMSEQGYDARQIGLSLIKPLMGKKVTTKRRKQSAAEKAKQKLTVALVRRKANAKKAREKAKAKAQARAEAKANVSPEDSMELEEAAELEDVAEAQEKWKD